MYKSVLVCLLILISPLFSAEYFISVDGKDSAERDGKSWDTGYASLEYTLKRLGDGPNKIKFGPGTYIIKKTMHLPSDLVLTGSGSKGDKATILIAGGQWKFLTSIDENKAPANEYLLAQSKGKNLEISHMSIESPVNQKITGGIYCSRSAGVTLHDINVENFRWSGAYFEKSSKVKIYNSRFHNAATDKIKHWGGNIRSTRLNESEIYNNIITSDTGGGYGYKGSGHIGTRLHHNTIKMNKGFSIESAHEHEFGLEIDHNYITTCISVPKHKNGANPEAKGFKYSVWIHHNHLEDSYTVEGPRSYLKISHNYIKISKTNGRCYTMHSGDVHGPTWIHNNVIENVDRAVVWMNRGYASNVHFYNNTVFMAKAGERSGALFGAYESKRLDNWTVKNNIFIAPADEPRSLIAQKRGVHSKVVAKNNICVNITNVPEGNFTNIGPKFSMTGEKPWAFYLPAAENSNLVDKGIKVELPFKGEGIDIGAMESGSEIPVWKVGAKGE